MDCSRSAKVASSPPRPASQGQRGRAHADSSSSSDARLRSSQIASFARSKRPSSYASRSSPSTRSSSSARRSAHATRSHAARRTRARSRVALSRRRRSPDHRERWHDARRLARGSRRDRRRDPPRERARQRHSRRARLADDRGERALHRRAIRSPIRRPPDRRALARGAFRRALVSADSRLARDATVPRPPRAATVPPRGIRRARVAHRQLARIRGSPSRAALGGARVHRVGRDVCATAIAHVAELLERRSRARRHSRAARSPTEPPQQPQLAIEQRVRRICPTPPVTVLREDRDRSTRGRRVSAATWRRCYAGCSPFHPSSFFEHTVVDRKAAHQHHGRARRNCGPSLRKASPHSPKKLIRSAPCRSKG